MLIVSTCMCSHCGTPNPMGLSSFETHTSFWIIWWNTPNLIIICIKLPFWKASSPSDTAHVLKKSSDQHGDQGEPQRHGHEATNSETLPEAPGFPPGKLVGKWRNHHAMAAKLAWNRATWVQIDDDFGWFFLAGEIHKNHQQKHLHFQRHLRLERALRSGCPKMKWVFSWGYHHSWMVYRRKSHSNRWFGDTPILGNPQMMVHCIDERILKWLSWTLNSLSLICLWSCWVKKTAFCWAK